MKRLLIANRGEIARRIIRTAHRMGIETVAVYSDADQHAPHVREATMARHLGPAPARESYLDQAKVLAAAKEAGADAVHPGYGFLSENADFAAAVIDAGMIWVGPPPSAITAMGLKDAAKRLMAEAGVPTTPGYLGDDQATERLQTEADRIGYPVLIKAVAGGGGKGMRKVERAEDFASALASCQREAASSFGDDRVLLEVYVTRPRHIEVQVFADAWGNVVHLYERDCSLQRRHQKVIEEAPAPGMTDEVRAAITGAAIKAARAVGYQGAGTIEFIADGSGPLNADRIWFMEMNTRLQVEHPVTEMITGLDLVEWQIRVARGEPLPLAQGAIPLNGHAMEARLYAENPAKGFLPSTGPLEHFRLPTECDGVRVDTGVEEGGEVTPFYDPMIAKIIVHAPTREAAAHKLAEACAEVEVWPVKTNAGFLVRCAEHPDFVAGQVDTGFIEARLEGLTKTVMSSSILAGAFGQLADQATHRPKWGWRTDKGVWSADPGTPTGFRLNANPGAPIRIEHDGAIYSAKFTGGRKGYSSWWNIQVGDALHQVGDAGPEVWVDGRAIHSAGTEETFVLFDKGDVFEFSAPNFDLAHAGSASDGALTSPMPGRIVSVGAVAGARVSKGQAIVTLEAMKMEHALTAPFDGVLRELSVKVGDQVAEGVALARVEADS
jgi:propionyl-CoA carboxylase alpha chain/3-methylcrotonyl-CoA carboxylase alpha subunit